jgi:hypothetical protein
MFDYQNSSIMQAAFAAKSIGRSMDMYAPLKTIAQYIYAIDKLDEIAYIQNELKDYEGSVATLNKMASISMNNQEKYSIRANLAKMYNHLNKPEESLAESQLNDMVSNGNDLDTWMEMAFSYYLLGQYNKSEEMMRKISCIDNISDELRGRVEYNLGSYDIEHGEFKKGIRGFIDVGHKIGIWHPKGIDGVPTWKGETDKQFIVIHGEGGIGDELINFRFTNNIKSMGLTPIWITNHKELVPVFERHDVKTIMNHQIDKENSYQINAMYLPIVLDLDADQLWSGAYLIPCSEHVAKWRDILPSGRKIGVKWSGNPAYEQDLHRGLTTDFIDALEFDAVKVNLQIDALKDHYFSVPINSIEDTLAILSLVDVTVTSCTSVAHMAGAIGSKVIVCPPIACYYVWLGRNDGYSNWYGKNTMVVRQTKHNNRDDVLVKVNELLSKV